MQKDSTVPHLASQFWSPAPLQGHNNTYSPIGETGVDQIYLLWSIFLQQLLCFPAKNNALFFPEVQRKKLQLFLAIDDSKLLT